jgi:outer membrane beta-barrel protein
MKMKKTLLACAFASSTASALVPAVVSAQELVDRKSPLAEAPAIRHRVELRDKRFETGVGIGSSVAAEFYNAVFLNLRLAFHVNDWLTLSGTFGQNLAPGYKTGVTENLETSLKAVSPTDAAAKTPTAKQALGAMNKMNQILGVQAEVAPITGKLSLFGKIFMHYDVYALGGVGAANFGADLPKCNPPKVDDSCPDTGMKVGGNVGLGMHAYFNDWLALNLEAKDLIVKTNRAGQDTTGDGFADKRDLSWGNNYIMGMNLTFFFPTLPKISD